MDVFVKALVISVAISLTACGKKESASDPVLKTTDVCSSAEIKNQYIAKWKNGAISRVKVSSRNALIEKFIEPNREELEYVEPDTYIEVPKTMVDTTVQTMAVEINWQHTNIRTAYAWDRNLKGDNVIVAVIDSGADISHPQLQNQLSRNAGEIPGNNVDDDGNGYVDDYNGYDFFRRSGVITDSNGHGTHVAGIIVAEHNADVNLPKGVAPKAKLLPLNFMDNNGRGSTSNAILALRYARDRGAKIVNASWGSADCSETLKEAVVELETAGVLIFAAAGNNGLNIDYYPNYPASFTASNIVAVAASTSRSLTADFSNYSVNAVHVAAPGKDIYSTTPNNTYAFFSGTSMAAPVVSGLAAIVWSAFPAMTSHEVKTAINAGTEGQFYPVITRGEVDVRKTLEALNIL